MKKSQIQTEVDAYYLYQKLSENEADPIVASVFAQMSEIEKGHAVEFAKAMNKNIDEFLQPSWRAKTLNRIGKIFGYDYVLGALMDTEKSLATNVIRQKAKSNAEISGNEDSHVKILRSILDNETRVSGTQMARFEKRHRSVGGNAIRAAVLGGNDGLVSNFSLVMGIAGATTNQQGVLLAGVAGLLAGAISMALGEWLSVQSSKELYENQIALETEELENLKVNGYA